MQCVAVCYSGVQCVAVYCSVRHYSLLRTCVMAHAVACAPSPTHLASLIRIFAISLIRIFAISLIRIFAISLTHLHVCHDLHTRSPYSEREQERKHELLTDSNDCVPWHVEWLCAMTLTRMIACHDMSRISISHVSQYFQLSSPLTFSLSLPLSLCSLALSLSRFPFASSLSLSLFVSFSLSLFPFISLSLSL